LIEYSWLDHLIAFLLLVVLPITSVRSGSIEGVDLDLPPKKHLYYTNGLALIIAGSVILTIWNVHRRPWDSLGIDWIIPSPIALVALAISVFIYSIDLWWNVRQSKSNDDEVADKSMRSIIPLTRIDFQHYIFLAVAAGVCEEIIYRGFLIPYVMHWFSSLSFAQWIAIGLPALSFGISHLYQGWAAVVKIVIIAICLGTIFYYSESLIIVIVLHILIDLASGYVGMKTMSDPSTDQEIM
jgi:uncharacterized protein